MTLIKVKVNVNRNMMGRPDVDGSIRILFQLRSAEAYGQLVSSWPGPVLAFRGSVPYSRVPINSNCSQPGLKSSVNLASVTKVLCS